MSAYVGYVPDDGSVHLSSARKMYSVMNGHHRVSEEGSMRWMKRKLMESRREKRGSSSLRKVIDNLVREARCIMLEESL